MSSPAHRYVLAGDLGSSACKTILWRSDGTVVAGAAREYPTHHPQPGAAEQTPDDWWDAFAVTARETIARAGVPAAEIVAAGLVGVTHNAVLLDEAEHPVRPCVLLFDTRSASQVARLRAQFGDDAFRTHAQNDISPMWTLPQLAWIREHEPDAWRRTARVVFQKDHVRGRLTGVHGVTDEIDAAGSLLWDARERRWIDAFLDALALPREWLPRIVAPFAPAGQVTAEAAAATGLRTGTPVFAGTTDTVAEMLGAGALRAGEGMIKLASVGRIAVVHGGPVVRPHVINYRHVLPELWYPGTSSKHAASAYRWLRDTLCSDVERRDPEIFRRLDALAAASAPGANGVLFHPHLSGEWAPHFDDTLRASFSGLSLATTRGDLIRAVLEGVAFAVREALEDFEAAGGLRLAAPLLVGEGARSGLWRQIVADVLGRPLIVSRHTGAAYGAALITAVAAGLIDGAASALRTFCPVDTTIAPGRAAHERYATTFAAYRCHSRSHASPP